MDGYIPPEQRPTYEKCMKFYAAVGEHAAPELFRWLGWSVAIAAVQVVAIKTGAWWLDVIPWVLFAAVLLRINWRLQGIGKDDEALDGGLTFRVSIPRALMAALLGWALAFVFAYALPARIAQSDLLKDVNLQ